MPADFFSLIVYAITIVCTAAIAIGIFTGKIIDTSRAIKLAKAGVPIENEDSKPFNMVDIVMVLCLVYLFAGFGTATAPDEIKAPVFMDVVFQGIFSFVLVSFIVIRYAARKNLKYLAFTPITLKRVLLYPLAALGIAYLVLIFTSPIGMMVEELTRANPQQEVVQQIKEHGKSEIGPALIFLAVIIAPISEEIIFRGYLFPAISFFTSKWFGGITTAVFFGAIHNNFSSFFPLAIFGGILAYLYYRTQSILPCIMAHFFFNALNITAILSP